MEEFNYIRKDLRRFHTSSNRMGVVSILEQYLLLGITYMTIYYLFNNILIGIIFYPIFAFILAGLYFGFFILLHNVAHYTLFKNKWLNKQADILGVFLIFEDIPDYQRIHFKHHKYLGQKNDPEEDLKKRWNTDNASHFELYVINFITMKYTLDFIIYQIIPFFKRNSIRKTIFWITFIGISLIISIKYFFLFYVIPILIFYPYIYFLGVAHEHIIKPKKDDNSFFLLSRNNINGIVNRFLLHRYNDGYHALHHFDPSIPYYLLPQAHEYMKNKHGIEFIEEGFIETISK